VWPWLQERVVVVHIYRVYYLLREDTVDRVRVLVHSIRYVLVRKILGRKG
jgi:hypothetical protein